MPVDAFSLQKTIDPSRPIKAILYVGHDALPLLTVFRDSVYGPSLIATRLARSMTPFGISGVNGRLEARVVSAIVIAFESRENGK